MEPITQLAVLAVATAIAAVAAFGMAWAFLLGAFRLMRPVGARPVRPVRLQLVQGTRAAARAFARDRRHS
jgi:hypothetical protein